MKKRKARVKRKKKIARKVMIAKKSKPKAKASARPGYDIHTGKPTGRDASAMQRLEKLTEKYVAEGMSLAEARAKARAVVEIYNKAGIIPA
jgi:hypothetical protein